MRLQRPALVRIAVISLRSVAAKDSSFDPILHPRPIRFEFSGGMDWAAGNRRVPDGEEIELLQAIRQ